MMVDGLPRGSDILNLAVSLVNQEVYTCSGEGYKAHEPASNVEREFMSASKSFRSSRTDQYADSTESLATRIRKDLWTNFE